LASSQFVRWAADSVVFRNRAQLLFRLVAVASHWPFEQWGRFLPEQTTTVSILDRLLHHATVVTTGDSHRMKDAKHREHLTNP
jgi:DNA replication protein DnaC